MGTEKAHRQYTMLSPSQIADEVDRQTRTHMREHRERDYAIALRLVLDADEALKRAYARVRG